MANVGFVIVPDETLEEHYALRGWESPEDKILDNYEYWLQPTHGFGSYEETIDFGVVYNNVIINVNFSVVAHVGEITVTTKIATSTDDVTYTAFVVGKSQFAQTLRYVKIRLEFETEE